MALQRDNMRAVPCWRVRNRALDAGLMRRMLAMTQHRLLARHPQLRDRLCAFAVFTGIAIGGVSGVEMVIGGGFDTITPSLAFQAEAPRTWYDAPIAPGAGWLSEPYTPASTVVTLGAQFDSGYPLDTDASPEPEELEGGARTPSAPTQASAHQAPSHDALADAFAEEPAAEANNEVMSAIEARMAQALPDVSIENTPGLTTDVAKEISGSAAPL